MKIILEGKFSFSENVLQYNYTLHTKNITAQYFCQALVQAPVPTDPQVE